MTLPAEIGPDRVAGEVIGVDGEVLVLISEQAHAPGAPITLQVELPRQDDSAESHRPLMLEGKSRGSRRRPDGRFDVRVRLVNLTRTRRACLVIALSGRESATRHVETGGGQLGSGAPG